MTGNRCHNTAETGTQKHGIEETGQSDHNLIGGNFCRGNLEPGIVTVGKGTQVTGNLQ